MTGLIVGGVDTHCNKSRKEKNMSVIKARWALLAAAVALSACSGTKPSGQFGSHASDASNASNASAAHDMTGMAMPSTGDPDTDFLLGMIPHHEGAVTMARAEIANGTDPRVRALAREVIATQQAEIKKMQAWVAERRAAKKEKR